MTQATIEPGTVLLGKYVVERVLGTGGMGVVAAARHMELGELFAVKLMLESDIDQAEPIERFLREARASAKLKSEHAVRVHDVGRLPSGTPYMVMEYLSGQDLREVLRARGALAIDEAVRFVLEACEAVAEAHAVGVVHRDLKPANLFLARRPTGPPIVKVLDFGISKELDPQERVGADLTRTGSLLGSPNYMSPEQMTRVKEVDPRSDIWSLGVVLFQLLTAQLPFQGTVLTEVIARVLTEEPPRPSSLRAALPPELEAIILRCLQKKPELRFQSVIELMAALEPFSSSNAPRVPMRPTEFSIAETLRRDLLPVLPSAAPAPITPIPKEIPTTRAWGTTATPNSAPPGRRGLFAFAIVAAALLAVGLYFAFIGLGDSAKTSAEGGTSPSTSTTPPPVLSSSSSNAALTTTTSASAAPPDSSSTSPRPKPRSTVAPTRAAGTPTGASTRKLPGFDD